MKKIIKSLIPSSLLSRRHAKISYSQHGEDLLVQFALDRYGIKSDIKYLDIGANHAFVLSNTYRLYKEGGTGILVEPDPSLCKDLKRMRPRDNVLNIGIGFNQSVEIGKLYIMSASVLNTFSEEEAKRINEVGKYHIVDVLDIPLVPINILMEEFNLDLPNFVSLDTEGLDLKILESFDFTRYRPQVFCVETLEYREDGKENKLPGINALFKSNDYFVFADTYINTIYVDRNMVK